MRTVKGEVMWPRLVASKFLGRNSRVEYFNTDGRDTESETDEEEAVGKHANHAQGPSPLSATPPVANDQQQQQNQAGTSPGKPPKPPSPASFSKASSPSSSSSNSPTFLQSSGLRRMNSETLWTDYLDIEEYKIFVGTWNVAGSPPPEDLDLQDWLRPNDPSDIYVIGFQEIVPLKAGNVFGSDDMRGPASDWESLIRRTLNGPASEAEQTKRQQQQYRSSGVEIPGEQRMMNPIARSRSAPSAFFHSVLNSHKDGSSPPKEDAMQLLLHRKSSSSRSGSKSSSSRSGSKSSSSVKPEEALQLKVKLLQGDEADDEAAAEYEQKQEQPTSRSRRQRYRRVVSKQMVGLFISVWVRTELRRDILDLKVSCVGCGIMGCLGNKGSISVSVSIHETHLCFVCTHLASGQKEGDELRRNSDVVEILKRTNFNRSLNDCFPKTILGHDRIIWFGDLNYRLSLSDSDVRPMLEKGDWKTLLQSDQLRMELGKGRTFEGWHEGNIDFPPTYKYLPNSGQFCGLDGRPGEKRRVPAWCDRVLWYGKGMKQLMYDREEFKLSDHRPVVSKFLVEVEVLNDKKVKQSRKLNPSTDAVPPPDMTKLISLEMKKLSIAPHGLEVLEVLGVTKPEKILLDALPEDEEDENFEREESLAFAAAAIAVVEPQIESDNQEEFIFCAGEDELGKSLLSIL